MSQQERELTSEGFGRVLSKIEMWIKIAEIADAPTLIRLLDGMLDTATIFSIIFERRFPKEFKEWDKKND